MLKHFSGFCLIIIFSTMICFVLLNIFLFVQFLLLSMHCVPDLSEHLSESYFQFSFRYIYIRLLLFFGEGNGKPLQYSCLENSMDRETWWATVHGVTKSQTRLSD